MLALVSALRTVPDTSEFLSGSIQLLVRYDVSLGWSALAMANNLYVWF
jgi:hypothetical protein